MTVKWVSRGAPAWGPNPQRLQKTRTQFVTRPNAKDRPLVIGQSHIMDLRIGVFLGVFPTCSFFSTKLPMEPLFAADCKYGVSFSLRRGIRRWNSTPSIPWCLCLTCTRSPNTRPAKMQHNSDSASMRQPLPFSYHTSSASASRTVRTTFLCTSVRLAQQSTSRTSRPCSSTSGSSKAAIWERTMVLFM